MGGRDLSNLFASVLQLPARKKRNKIAQEHRRESYPKATEHFITFYSDLMQRHFLNEHFRRMSLKEQGLCRRFHRAVAFEAIANFKKLGERPTKKWVMNMIRQVSPDANHLFGLSTDYFLGFARAILEAYVRWFENSKPS